jgi:hypothetical protein
MEILDYKALVRSRYTDLVRGYPAYVAYVEALCDLLEEKQVEAKVFLDGLMDIDQSVGVQLDIIGKIVGQDRNLVLFTAEPYFGFEGGREAQAFDVGTWRSILSPQGGTNRKLNDDEYRIILKARIAANKSKCTVSDTLEVINILAGNTTTRIVNGEISGNATIVVTEPNGMLGYFLTQLDKTDSLIPTPLGVKVKVAEVA